MRRIDRRALLRASLLALAAWPAAAAARRYEGQDFDEQLTLAGQTLLLNGTGKRAVAIFKGYLAGLYLARKASTTEGVLAVPGAKRVDIRMLLDVDAEEFVKAVNKGVARNCGEAERVALAERQELFIKNLRLVGKVRKRDLIHIDFVPEQGTLLLINGKLFGTAVPGADLYAAILKVFLGDLPVDKRLKAGLLGDPNS